MRVNEKVKNVLHEMKEGAMSVLRNRGLSWVFLFSTLVTFFLMPVSVLFPLMTLKHFAGDAFQVSLIEILWGVGALLGGAVMGARVWKVNKVVLVNLMYLLIGVSFLLSGLLPSNGFVIFAILTAVGGVSGAVYNSAFTGIVQTSVEPSALGRVFSMFFTLSLIPSLIGLIGIGFFADGLGIANSFVACGAIIVLVGVLSFTTPSALRLGRANKIVSKE
jgi:DHA3 family macrolide efflux protein-like MFS transporter